MGTPIEYKHGDILKSSSGCLIVLKHDKKLYAHWLFNLGKPFAGPMDIERIQFPVEKIGEFTEDMARAIEELFLEYYEGNKNV